VALRRQRRTWLVRPAWPLALSCATSFTSFHQKCPATGLVSFKGITAFEVDISATTLLLLVGLGAWIAFWAVHGAWAALPPGARLAWPRVARTSSTARAHEAIRVSDVPVLLVNTIGTRAPSTMPAD
jgi:hypothetical protein